MATAKKLGIWMDHSRAHLMEFTSSPIHTNVIEVGTPTDNARTPGSGENQIHKREQHQLTVYYKRLREAILHYEEVIIFGPTDAKVELLNTLRKDHHFANIKINIQDADKMTENQQHAFVRKYFSGL